MRLSNLSNLVVLTALLVPGAAFGASDIRLGLGGGFDVNGISTTPSLNSSSRTGILLGATLEFPLSAGFCFVPGLGYVQKGYAVGTFYQTAHYLDFPLLLKFRMPVTPELTFDGVAGPDLGIEVGTYWSNLLGGVFYNTLDLALNVGIGVEYELADQMRPFVQVSYSLGLLNVVDNSDGDSGITGTNHGLQILMGVNFPL